MLVNVVQLCISSFFILHSSFLTLSLSSLQFPSPPLQYCRRRRTSKFSPGHMYDTSAKASTEERELHPIDNGTSQPPINEKEKEALEESAIVPPPTAPRSAITTEGKKRMHRCISMTQDLHAQRCVPLLQSIYSFGVSGLLGC